MKLITDRPRYPNARQTDRILDIIMSGGWWSADDIGRATGYPQEIIESAVRNLFRRNLIVGTRSIPPKYRGKTAKVR